MKMRIVDWRGICDEVRYWDAMDFLRNLEDEMENARRGLVNWMFCPGAEYPFMGEARTGMLLKPEITARNDHIEIAFPNLDEARKEDIDVEIEGRDLSVNVKIGGSGGKESLGWFRMRVPDDMDAEACEARHDGGILRICLRRRKALPAKRRIALR